VDQPLAVTDMELAQQPLPTATTAALTVFNQTRFDTLAKILEKEGAEQFQHEFFE
jgi:hypothetical protein